MVTMPVKAPRAMIADGRSLLKSRCRFAAKPELSAMDHVCKR